MTDNFEGAEELGELLSRLSAKQLKFWEIVNEGKVTQAQAYRQAYDAENMARNSIIVEASRLWNCPKFTLLRIALKNSMVEQSARTLAYRINEMEAFADRCEAHNQWGAAGKARENAAKLEGHYVIKTQSVASRTDDLSLLKEIAKDGSKESIAFAMKEAKSLGLDKELKEALGTVH